MKVLTLELGEKTYTTGKITAFISRKAIEIQEDSVALSDKGLKIYKNSQTESEVSLEDTEKSINETGELLQLTKELMQKKSWLICEAYQNKFTIDDLEKELSNEEIDAEIQRILNGVQGVISKN